MSTPDPYRWLKEELEQLDQSGLRRRVRRIDPLPGGRCRVDGRECWNFATNDYLGLAGDDRLAQAAMQAIRETGVGSRASPLVCGRSAWHEQLEARLAAFKKSDAALLFPSGYAANVGTVAALVAEGDEVWTDRLNHASLIDGCRLSGARLRVYPHIDVDELRRQLKRGSTCRRRLIVTDSLFSMDGDAAPLRDLADLAVETDSMLLVDEAHATGIFGSSGAGLLEQTFTDNRLPVPDCVLSIGTLSKALGGQGGFLAGPQSVIDWCVNKARSLVFSTALAPASCAAAVAALDIVSSASAQRAELQNRSSWLIQQLRELGGAIPPGVAGPIIPVIIGDAAAALEISAGMLEIGILVPAIRPPSVPQRGSRLRISLTAVQNRSGLDELVIAFGDIDHFLGQRPIKNSSHSS